MEETHRRFQTNFFKPVANSEEAFTSSIERVVHLNGGLQQPRHGCPVLMSAEYRQRDADLDALLVLDV